MHPRTIAILVAAVLLLALVLRVVIHQTGLLPLNEETVLKKATSLMIAYTSEGVPKKLTVDSPEQLADLFSVLELRDGNDRGARGEEKVWAGPGGRVGGAVTFRFPDGTRRELHFEQPNWLGPSQVNQRFFQKLCDYVSRAEGKRIDLFENNPVEK